MCTIVTYGSLSIGLDWSGTVHDLSTGELWLVTKHNESEARVSFPAVSLHA